MDGLGNDYDDEGDGDGWGDYDQEEDEYKISDVEPVQIEKSKSSYSMEKVPYKIVKMEEIIDMIPSFVKQVRELLANEEDEAITLLRHYNWNVQKLQD